MRTATPLDGLPVGQVGILVKDVEAALDLYAPFFGQGSWLGYVYGPENVARLQYRDEPAQFRVKVALSSTTPQIELLQQVSGPSIYEEWAAAHGLGLHHLGFIVDSVEAAIAAMERAGYRLLQAGIGTGVHGDGGFAYFDTEPALGVILEAIEIPAVRRPPDFTYP